MIKNKKSYASQVRNSKPERIALKNYNRSEREEIISNLRKKSWLRNTECVNDKLYLNITFDILNSEPFQKMEEYTQHGKTTTLDHCISVSYFSYKMCRFMNVDYVSAARAGLLHDLFLYDWHTHCKDTGNHFHGFTHPVVALNNATKYYALNNKEKDIIVKHMWPLTIVPPKNIEGYVVMYADKYCTVHETAVGTVRKIIASV